MEGKVDAAVPDGCNARIPVFEFPRLAYAEGGYPVRVGIVFFEEIVRGGESSFSPNPMSRIFTFSSISNREQNLFHFRARLKADILWAIDMI